MGRKKRIEKSMLWILMFALPFILVLGLEGTGSRSPILVYEGEKALLEGRFSIGTVVPEGVLIQADVALKAEMTPWMGSLGGSLHHGVVSRLDRKLNVAYVEWGGEIDNPDFQSRHVQNSKGVEQFLPVALSSSSEEGAEGLVPSGTVLTGPFDIKINGIRVDGEMISLPVTKKASSFDLELVRLSTTSVWHVDAQVVSDPPLGFWKKGKSRGLNDVPQQTFKYRRQIFFMPLRQGKALRVPVEVFYVKERNYTWTIEVTTKKDSMKKTVQVQFEEKR